MSQCSVSVMFDPGVPSRGTSKKSITSGCQLVAQHLANRNALLTLTAINFKTLYCVNTLRTTSFPVWSSVSISGSRLACV
jgi:hypothetical protein